MCAEQHLDGQINITEVLKYMHQYQHRKATEENKDPSRSTYLRLLMDKIHRDFQNGQELIKLISENLDFLQLRLQMALHSGMKGRVNMSVTDLLAQAPVHLQVVLSKAMNMGYVPPVPYILAVRPLESGDVHIEVC